MWPGRIGSPSAGCAAGSGPARPRIAGSTLFTPGARCQTMKTAAGRSAGRPATSFSSAAMPPAEGPTTTMSFVATPGAQQASRPRRERRDGLRSGAEFFHQQDGAVTPLRRRDERRAGDVALDFPAAPVDRVEHDFLVVLVTDHAGAYDIAQLGDRQADVEVEERAPEHLVGAQAPEVLGAPVP